MACSHFEQGEAGITVDHATWRQHSPQPDLLTKTQTNLQAYLSEKFGFHRARVLSEYPKKWLRLAIEAAAPLPPPPPRETAVRS
jgi:hypothetical protein